MSSWNADLYNQKHNFVYDYGKGLIDLLKPEKKEAILDIGCGTGALTHEIDRLCEVAMGIDQSASMIEKAKADFPNVEFAVQDVCQMNFQSKFDAIFSNATLHWVLDFQTAIERMYAALKPNGKLVLEMGGKGNIQTIENALRASLHKHGFEQQANLKQWFFPSIGEYTTALESADFEVKLAQHYDRPTVLADSNNGIFDWLSMFAQNFFKGVPMNIQELIKLEVQATIKEQCFQNNQWVADYKRLRIIAIK